MGVALMAKVSRCLRGQRDGAGRGEKRRGRRCARRACSAPPCKTSTTTHSVVECVRRHRPAWPAIASGRRLWRRRCAVCRPPVGTGADRRAVDAFGRRACLTHLWGVTHACYTRNCRSGNFISRQEVAESGCAGFVSSRPSQPVRSLFCTCTVSVHARNAT
jgi:hypothetical protein